jgi:hypothetical protein
MSCDDGFDFDIEPLPLYYCGPQTSQEWNFQNDENPDRRIPSCVGMETSFKAAFSFYFRFVKQFITVYQ